MVNNTNPFLRLTCKLMGQLSLAIIFYSSSMGVKQNEEKSFDFSSFVIPLRFERKTHALEGRCSIQLSYGTYLLCK